MSFTQEEKDALMQTIAEMKDIIKNLKENTIIIQKKSVDQNEGQVSKETIKKDKRLTQDNFMEYLQSKKQEREFLDGTTKSFVHGSKIARKIWPFEDEEKQTQFTSLYDVAEHFGLECCKDGDNPNVYILLE